MTRLLLQTLKFVVFAICFHQILLVVSRGLGLMGHSELASMLTHPNNDHGYIVERTREWQQLLDDGRNPSALFFGSSTVMHGIVPSVVDSLGGMDTRNGGAFSWASERQDLGQIPHLLRAALSESQPQKVFIGLSPRAWRGVAENTPETELNFLTVNTLNSPAWKRAAFSIAWEAASPHAIFLAFHRMIAGQTLGPLPQPSRPQLQEYAGRGHVVVHNNINPYAVPHKIEETAVFPDGWCEKVLEIEALCEAQNVELIWLFMPVYMEVPFDMPDCLTASNILRGDLWPDVWVNGQYADFVHLTESGARDFTTWLLEEARKMQRMAGVADQNS